MAFGDEVYSDESLEQRAKRMVESHERAVKVVQEALAKAQRAQDARDRLLENLALVVGAIGNSLGNSNDPRAADMRSIGDQMLSDIAELRLNTGRDVQGKRPDTK